MLIVKLLCGRIKSYLVQKGAFKMATSTSPLGLPEFKVISIEENNDDILYNMEFLIFQIFQQYDL